jgi:hypothetical protein
MSLILRCSFSLFSFWVLFIHCTCFNASAQEIEPGYFLFSDVSVREVSQHNLGLEDLALLNEKGIELKGIPNFYGDVGPLGAGNVITTARDLVALGEDIYRLIIKGKPTNTTSYAPISVIPKVNGQPVDLLETENWQVPKKRTFEVVYKNVYAMEVVKFRYSVIYSYRGKYNNRGAYLTAVQVIPESIRTLFGFDFTATMKVGGIQNQGTRQNPIAGVTLLMEYTSSSILVTQNKVDTFFITGVGDFKKL